MIVIIVCSHFRLSELCSIDRVLMGLRGLDNSGGWVGYAGRVTLAGWMTFLCINTLVRLTVNSRNGEGHKMSRFRI